ncbi:MAG: Crp/Fnr family transcriptional regulator [Bryobacteraceae bacterium]
MVLRKYAKLKSGLTPRSQLVSEIPLFAGLGENETQALARRAVEKRFAAGEMLFWEGEPCAGIFLIAEGAVKIFKTAPSGREMMLALERAPSTVAELPLFDGGAYPASVRAAEPVVSYFIAKADFQSVCRDFPEIALKVLAVVGKRLRHLVAMIESITFGSVTQRLAGMLLDAARQARADEFPLPLTHQEMASRLGTVREVISRNLARFRAQGLIAMEGHTVAIRDRAGLQREAEIGNGNL